MHLGLLLSQGEVESSRSGAFGVDLKDGDFPWRRINSEERGFLVTAE